MHSSLWIICMDTYNCWYPVPSQNTTIVFAYMERQQYTLQLCILAHPSCQSKCINLVINVPTTKCMKFRRGWRVVASNKTKLHTYLDGEFKYSGSPIHYDNAIFFASYIFERFNLPNYTTNFRATYCIRKTILSSFILYINNCG